MVAHLHCFDQHLFQGLVLPIAQEAVCVDTVGEAIKFKVCPLLWVCDFHLWNEADLRGSSTEVQSAINLRGHWANPTTTKRILQKNIVIIYTEKNI